MGGAVEVSPTPITFTFSPRNKAEKKASVEAKILYDELPLTEPEVISHSIDGGGSLIPRLEKLSQERGYLLKIDVVFATADRLVGEVCIATKTLKTPQITVPIYGIPFAATE
ncbi:MAG: hypothetical protein WD669_10410 [Pirellulales bacterium]